MLCLAANPDRGPVFGVYESTAGSAPDIAGQGIANPVGTILSVGMMFNYSLGIGDAEQRLQLAVDKVLQQGIMTPDLDGNANCESMTTAIIAAL